MTVLDTRQGVLVRLVQEGPTPDPQQVRYAGTVSLDAQSFPVRVAVDALEVRVETGDLALPLPDALRDRVRLLVRSALRAASQEGLPPPRRLTRWRAAR